MSAADFLGLSLGTVPPVIMPYILLYILKAKNQYFNKQGDCKKRLSETIRDGPDCYKYKIKSNVLFPGSVLFCSIVYDTLEGALFFKVIRIVPL